jgi:hypothetical protein
MNLNFESINNIYQDYLGNEYLVLQEVKSCCRMSYYLLSEVGTNNEYPYDSMGRRLDHRFKVDTNSKFNLKE